MQKELHYHPMIIYSQNIWEYNRHIWVYQKFPHKKTAPQMIGSGGKWSKEASTILSLAKDKNILSGYHFKAPIQNTTLALTMAVTIPQIEILLPPPPALQNHNQTLGHQTPINTHRPNPKTYMKDHAREESPTKIVIKP